MSDLHHAIDVMHHPGQYSFEDLKDAHAAIQASPLNEFFKNYYENLYHRIKAAGTEPVVGALGYFGG